MKKLITILLLTFRLHAFSQDNPAEGGGLSVLTQHDDADGEALNGLSQTDPGDGEGTAVPVDGGLSLLLAAGAAYAGRRLCRQDGK
jgi:hypothetical protein